MGIYATEKQPLQPMVLDKLVQALSLISHLPLSTSNFFTNFSTFYFFISNLKAITDASIIVQGAWAVLSD
jgi:hypothetical protein